MQCPACNHIPLAGNQPDPSACPKCGVRYADAIRQANAGSIAAKQQAAAQQQSLSAMSPDVRAAIKQYKGAQPVVVLDVSMSFNSMVWFMIKWALAAIPAMIILSVIAVVLFMLFGVAIK